MPIIFLQDMRMCLMVTLGLVDLVHLVSHYAEDNRGLTLFHKQCERLTTPWEDTRRNVRRLQIKHALIPAEHTCQCGTFSEKHFL